MQSIKLFSLLIFIISIFIPINAYAISDKQKNLYDKGVLYYDLDGCTTGSGSTDNGTSASATDYYIVGDSLAVGMESADISGKLKENGAENITINASTGRSINNKGTDNDKTNGNGALDDDKEAIKKAGVAIVVLGTNPDSYRQDIPKYIKKIKGINKSIAIAWVNVGTTLPRLENNEKIVNDTLTDNKTKLSKIVDWNKEVDKNPGLISSDGYHPANYNKITELIVSEVKDLSSSGAKRGANGEITTDKSLKNEERIYSFLIAKGLTPIQAVGWLVNIEAESGFDPKAGEFGTSGNADPNRLNVGFGLIQWTNTQGDSNGRRYKAITWIKNKGGEPFDIDSQLNYMWKEITESYPKVYKDLKKATTIFEAQRIILEDYESPLQIHQDERNKSQPEKAKVWLKKLANINAASGSESTSDSNKCKSPTSDAETGLTAGKYGWNLEGSNKMVYYAQNDPKWSNKPYGPCNTIGASACGATSLAMVVSTLTNKKMDVPDMAAWAVKNGYRECSNGTAWAAFPAAAKEFGLKSKILEKNQLSEAEKTLRNGGLVIVSFGPNSYFTEGGHFVVMRKVSEDGNTFYFADPNSGNGNGAKKTNSKGFTKEFLMSDNILKMWTYEKE